MIEVSDIRLNKIKVRFESAPIDDIPAETRAQMERFRPQVKPGMTVAITVGSRGIANIAVIVRAVADSLKTFGAAPFIVPAMGSHGGATAEGQTAVLAGYGVTEEAMGVPIRSSMAVEALGEIPGIGVDPIKLYMDKNAYQADAVFIVNRVKAHTDFHGPNESGIAKMLVIGLGKHAQALATHAYLVKGLRRFVPLVAKAIIASGKILGALAIVEDGYDQTSILQSVEAERIVEEDAGLLIRAKQLMPALPFTQLDLLMIDWLGKDISGTGLDPNIVGRIAIRGEADSKPEITTICLFDLTPESHGNAIGVGIADLIPQRLADKIERQPTYENILTSRFLCRGAIPMTLPTDRETIAAGLSCCGCTNPKDLRLARIRDTLHIDEIYVSDALLAELDGNTRTDVLERGIPLEFDKDGALKKSAGTSTNH
jgi:hypothetical protein